MTPRSLVAMLIIAAVACGFIAYANREPEFVGSLSYEPDRPASRGELVGDPPEPPPFYEQLQSDNWFDPVDWQQPYLWVGLGIGAGLAAVGIIIATRRGRPHRRARS